MGVSGSSQSSELVGRGNLALVDAGCGEVDISSEVRTMSPCSRSATAVAVCKRTLQRVGTTRYNLRTTAVETPPEVARALTLRGYVF